MVRFRVWEAPAKGTEGTIFMLAFKQALHACITSQRIPDGFLKVVRPCLIPLHDLRDERSPARAVSIRVIYHRGHLCEKILRAVFSEFHRPQIQRSIFAVEQINILIVLLHGQWEYGLRVFQHRVTVLAKLELFDTVDEPLSGVLFRDLQRKQISFLKIVLHSFAQNNDLVRIFHSVLFALVDKLRAKS